MPKKNPHDPVAAILADCIAADPSLAAREAELRPLVASLLEAKPDTRFDADFARRLRSMLLAEHATQPNTNVVHHSFLERMRIKPLAWSLSGGALAVLVLAVILTKNGPSVPMQIAADLTGGSAAPKSGVIALGSSAFGSLSGTVSVTSESMVMADGDEVGNNVRVVDSAGVTSAPVAMDAPTPASISARPSAAPAAISRPQSGGGGASAGMVTPDAKMSIMPYDPSSMVNYRFVYKGDLTLPDGELDVYRHVPGLSASMSSFGRLLDGLLDAGKFGAGKLQNFSFMEDRDYGYTVHVDANDGAVSLSQMWNRWPHPENDCRDEACYAQYRLSVGQVPADDELKSVADAFLGEYGISRERLGEPEVRHDWRIGQGESPEYVPDSIAVVYPLALDGRNVMDESGMGFGISLNVNLRERRVDGAWGIRTDRYERSSYPAETDAARVMAVVEKGGNSYGWYEGAGSTVDVELGEPETVLTRYWHTMPDGNGQELFVPSLKFPVLNPPADQPWFRKWVIVPLVKELLDQQNSGPIMRPMPTPFSEPAMR